MDNAQLKSLMNEWKEIIERRLETLSRAGSNSPYAPIYDTVRYSLLNAGKRIRPILTLEFCRAAGGDPMDAMDCACAVEMIHTYSLIHDDLPCMDDDDTRRGKPSCHKVYGEATALLAGDALQSMSALTIASCKTAPANRLMAASAELARLSGPEGMIGGQLIDMDSEGKSITIDTLRAMVQGKTCALIEAACVMGCHIAGADETIIAAARDYARNLGLAFQIIDDVLDVVGDPKLLGKPVASDAGNEKSNYVSIMGLDGAKRFARIYTENAISALAPLGEKADFLTSFAAYLLDRVN